jgi:zinc protease
MDRHSKILPLPRNPQSKKACWVKVIFGLFLLAIAFRPAIGDPQTRPKPSGPGTATSNEKTAKIIGPFLSREDSDEYTKVVLKNGLTAVIFERQDVPLAAITVYVKVGLQNESQSQKGAAERVMRGVCFGRKHSPGRQVIQEISQFGGFMEGSCSTEYTQYSAIIPPNWFHKGMELEAEALRNPDFSEAMLPEENALAWLKSREILDSPGKYGLERLNQLMLPLTPGLEAEIREEEQASSLAVGDLQSFYKQGYVPGNIILVIDGSVDRRQALDEVVRSYGDMVSTLSDSASFPPESPQTIIRYLQLRSEIKQALVFIGFLGPRPYTSDWYACKLLQAILAEGNSSKLNYELCREQGLANSIVHQSLELRQQGGFSFSIATSARNVEAVEAAVFIELEKIKNGQLEDAEVERAKNLVERRFYLDQEDIAMQGRQLARFEDIARFSEWKAFVGKIRSLSRGEIVQAARQFFLLNRANIVESLPSGFPLRDMTQPELQKTLEIAVRAKVQESQIVEPLEPKKPKSPKTPNKDISLFYRRSSGELTSAWVNHELITYTVLHGPDVLVKQSQALPIISLGVFFSGGRIFENADNYGITELMLRASTRETLRLSPLQVVTGIESHGAELQTVVGRDIFGYVLTGTKPDFEKTLNMLASIISEPRFDGTQIEGEKRQLYSEMAAVGDNMDEFARQLFYETLFDQKPYGIPPLGTVESIKKIKTTDVSEWHNLWVKTVRPIIVIAGDTDGSDIVSLLSAKLGLSGKNPVELPRLSVMKQPGPFREQIQIQTRHHSVLVLGARTPSASPQLLHSMMAARELLSGPGSGLVEAMRNAGILPAIMDTRYEPGWAGSSFAISMSTLPDRRERILEVVDAEIRALQGKAIPDAECKRAIALASTREIRNWQHRNAQVIEYATLKNYGIEIEELRNFLGHIRDLERGDILEAVKSIGLGCQVIAGIEGKP